MLLILSIDKFHCINKFKTTSQTKNMYKEEAHTFLNSSCPVDIHSALRVLSFKPPHGRIEKCSMSTMYQFEDGHIVAWI